MRLVDFRNGMLFLLAWALVSPGAHAELIATTLASDSVTDPALLGFVAEARVGDGQETGTYELSLDAAPEAPNGNTSNYAWQEGLLENFALRYDPATGSAEYTVGNTTLTNTFEGLRISSLIIRPRADLSSTIILLGDIMVDAMATNRGAVGRSGFSRGLELTGVDYSDGFELTGTLQLRQSGMGPVGSELSIIVEALIPEPTVGFMWLIGIALTLDRRNQSQPTSSRRGSSG